MILVDTSVWIDHLHTAEPALGSLLDDDLVATHDAVVQELALGSLRDRDRFIGLVEALERVPTLRHEELIAFVDRHQLWGIGLSAVDAHLLGSARLARAALWTRDKRLRAAAERLGVAAA